MQPGGGIPGSGAARVPAVPTAHIPAVQQLVTKEMEALAKSASALSTAFKGITTES